MQYYSDQLKRQIETNHDTTWSSSGRTKHNECQSDFYQPRPKKWHGLDCVDDMDLILIRWPVWTGTNLLLFASFLGAWIIGYRPGTALIWPLHHLNTNTITLTPPQLQLRSTLLTPPKPYQLNRHPHHHSIGKRVSPLCQRKAPRPLHFVALERVVIWTQTYVPKNWKRYLVPIPTYIQRSLKSKSIHLTLPQNKD
jgi:hypothetical protein